MRGVSLVFNVIPAIPLIIYLDHIVGSPFWWLGDRSHGYFISLHYQIVHHHQNCAKHYLFHSHNSSINHISDFVDNFFSLTRSWHTPSPFAVNPSKILELLLGWGSKISCPIAPALVSLPMAKSFTVWFNWLICLLYRSVFFPSESMLCKNLRRTQSQNQQSETTIKSIKFYIWCELWIQRSIVLTNDQIESSTVE